MFNFHIFIIIIYVSYHNILYYIRSPTSQGSISTVAIYKKVAIKIARTRSKTRKEVKVWESYIQDASLILKTAW